MGNVLINFSHEKACEQIAVLVGRPAKEVFKVLFASGLEMRYEAGQISREYLLSELESGLACPPGSTDGSAIIEAACDIFWPKPDMEKLATHVKSAGYRMVLLSNVNEDHFTYIKERYQFPELFDELVLSYQVGVCKPHERIYRHAIAAARCEAHECAFIDDVQENVDAASRLGINAVTYRSTPDLVESLRSLGLKMP
jgi:putative hydrolase of the HAD superfamily